jgi:hypothetical protein
MKVKLLTYNMMLKSFKGNCDQLIVAYFPVHVRTTKALIHCFFKDRALARWYQALIFQFITGDEFSALLTGKISYLSLSRATDEPEGAEISAFKTEFVDSFTKTAVNAATAMFTIIPDKFEEFEEDEYSEESNEEVLLKSRKSVFKQYLTRSCGSLQKEKRLQEICKKEVTGSLVQGTILNVKKWN